MSSSISWPSWAMIHFNDLGIAVCSRRYLKVVLISISLILDIALLLRHLFHPLKTLLFLLYLTLKITFFSWCTAFFMSLHILDLRTLSDVWLIKFFLFCILTHCLNNGVLRHSNAFQVHEVSSINCWSQCL